MSSIKLTTLKSKETDKLISDISAMADKIRDMEVVDSIGFKEDSPREFVMIINEDTYWDVSEYETELEGLKATHSFVLGFYVSLLNIISKTSEIIKEESKIKSATKSIILPRFFEGNGAG